jgi:hypothetical protein
VHLNIVPEGETEGTPLMLDAYPPKSSRKLCATSKMQDAAEIIALSNPLSADAIVVNFAKRRKSVSCLFPVHLVSREKN